MINVLLADDHAVVRDGLRALLESQGDIKVVGVAADGPEAVACAQKLDSDVIVMDINMPGLNGIDACRRICERKPESRVLMLSMHGTSEHIYQALRAGARGYLLKESAGAEVVRAVRTLAAGRRYLGEKIADVAIEDYLAQRPKDSPIDRLSDREREVLQLVVDGKTNVEAAATLGLSVKTVETYRSRLMTKLGVDDLAGLVRFAIEHGLTQLRK